MAALAPQAADDPELFAEARAVMVDVRAARAARDAAHADNDVAVEAAFAAMATPVSLSQNAATRAAARDAAQAALATARATTQAAIEANRLLERANERYRAVANRILEEREARMVETLSRRGTGAAGGRRKSRHSKRSHRKTHK